MALSWEPPAGEKRSVTGYEILRGRDGAEPTALVADTGSTDTIYTDETATDAEATYSYRVLALRGERKSEPSNLAEVGPAPEADPTSLAPRGLSALGLEDGVSLSWEAPAQDADAVTGYRILRGPGEDELTTLVEDTGNTGTAHTDATATEAGAAYHYRVVALRGSEASLPSNLGVAVIPSK